MTKTRRRYTDIFRFSGSVLNRYLHKMSPSAMIMAALSADEMICPFVELNGELVTAMRDS